MKNLFATAASVLVLGFAAPAFADSNSNSSTIEQIGVNSEAIVRQLGTSNVSSSTVKQGVPWDGVSNATANVTQEGYGNDYSQGYGNLSSIIQNGRNDTADLYQGGSSNSNYSTIDQNGDGHSSENYANVNQSGYITDNVSTIDQDGHHNSATTLQGGSYNSNTSSVIQNGHGLTSLVQQY